MSGGNTNKKGRLKISLFADSQILLYKESKNSTGELLQLVNTFSKIAGYKMST